MPVESRPDSGQPDVIPPVMVAQFGDGIAKAIWCDLG